MIKRPIIMLLLLIFSISVCHANPPAPVPQTGQTTVYSANDDGAMKLGMPWPNPRFIDNKNGTVTDRLTGLVWLKDANCFGKMVWTAAVASANNLADGQCSLTDGSVIGDWRLPNVRELRSLVNHGETNSATWLNRQGFLNAAAAVDIQTDPPISLYFSLSSYAMDSTRAWGVDIALSGLVQAVAKSLSCYVWPVRDAQ